MQHNRSIRSRLYLVFALVLVLVVVLGLASLWRLARYHATAADIRDHYLPSTQALGTLNTLTSERRTAEATAALASTEEERAAHGALILRIDRKIAKAELDYESLSPLPAYEDFSRKWAEYLAKPSHDAYEAAADALWVVTERNREAATAAVLHSDSAFAQALRLTFASLILAGAVVAAALIHVRRAIFTPMLDLARTMRRLAADDLSAAPGDIDRKDEIGEMARAVEVFREQALMLNEKLANERHVVELQRNFVSMASHEFRTPLAAIDGLAQRLIATRERTVPEEIAERAGKIRQSVIRMTGLIANLLESARLIDRSGAPTLRLDEIDLAQLLRDVCSQYREMTPQARIVETLPADKLPMSGDQRLLFQVFSNLVSNAVKYAPENSTVEILAVCEGGSLRVSVSDKGMGIPEKDLGKVFDRYFRGSNVTGTVGTGIGLYLVRTVVELHGGTVSVQSAEGTGTTFAVTLPQNLGICASSAEPAIGER